MTAGEGADWSVDPESRLARRLGMFDAVTIGLGSMIGAGIFVALGPAAAAAGGGLLLGLVLAALIAFCNATSSARLAVLFPTSGGTYAYGREVLGPAWGFLAGWGFVIGKIASCAAIAMVIGTYASPRSARPIAIAAVACLSAVNLLGVRKTALLTKALVGLVLGSLAAVVAAALSADPSSSRIGSLFHGGADGILEAAGMLFFAFAGFARLATLGEEVRDPRRTIARAIPLALSITLGIYAVVSIAALSAVGPDVLALSATPLREVAEAGDLGWVVGVVRTGAVVASAGVLMSLLAGLSRTSFAMASQGDLPRFLSAVHPRRRIPHRAEVAVAIIVGVVVAIADVRGAIGFSSFAVLGYYAITNLAAWSATPNGKPRSRVVPALGLLGCATLALSLPQPSVLGGAALYAAGAIAWAARSRLGSRRHRGT